jgi:hypothetical protein
MSKTFKGGTAAMAAVLLAATLLVTGCPSSDEPGPVPFTVNETPVDDLDAMKSRMASEAAAGRGASIADPIRATIAIADMSLLSGPLSGINDAGTDCLHKLFDAIPSGKYVAYDLRGSTFTSIPAITSATAGARKNTATLMSITLPDTLTTIGDYAFAEFNGLTTVTIPGSVTSIGTGAFAGCSGLTTVTIPASVTSIGTGAFYNCSSLTSVAIPAGVTSIGGTAFMLCSSLTTVAIGAGVTSIGERAFRECSSLTTVTIPAGVTSIGDVAFDSCSSLTSIYVQRRTTPLTTLGFSVFSQTHASLVIYVLPGTVAGYKGMSGWRTFASKIQAAP